MALYNYQAASASGAAVKGLLEAKNEEAVVKQLQEKGYFPVEVGLERPPGAAAFFFSLDSIFKGRVSGREVAGFTHELSTLIDAGITLDMSLSILAPLEKNQRLRAVILKIHEGIRGGKTFSSSLEEHPEIFPEIFVSTVRAGEAGGALEESLSRLKRFMEESERLKDEIRSALIYPLILTTVGGGAVLLMLLFVIPKFSAVFADAGGVMPLPARVLLAVSDCLISYWWALPALICAAAFGFGYFIRTEGGRSWIDGLKLKSPLLGHVFQKVTVSRFSRTLGMLLHGGIPVIEALMIAEKTAGNSVVRSEIKSLIEGVRSGRGLSAPMKEMKTFPPLAVHLITVGDETGKLDDMLIKLSENYDRDITTAIKRLLSLLEPAIILIMAVVVGFIVVSLLLSIFSINDIPV